MIEKPNEKLVNDEVEKSVIEHASNSEERKQLTEKIHKGKLKRAEKLGKILSRE